MRTKGMLILELGPHLSRKDRSRFAVVLEEKESREVVVVCGQDRQWKARHAPS
jgi:hypothetical protein